MQDPSAGVQPPLDKHVHLICGRHYPLIAQLTLDQAARYLLEAPAVVKQMAPMSWTYVSAPQDGTIWLEWLSPRQNEGRFPSDGYVWGDPEQAYRQDFNGYTIEILMHSAGFRPGIDHMTSHARTRYHLVAKAPHLNAASVDASLWIVHYHQAAQNRIMPANQLPVNDYTRHTIGERRWLESIGRIEQHNFMLHDREHWPTIPVPGQQMHPQAMYGANQMPNQSMMMAPNRYSQQAFPATGPPSAKRQRTHGPGAVLGPPQGLLQDNSIEEEEGVVAFGDYFDTLTPRNISLTRYQQHQQWMEEIFSSPYAAHEIVPVDLGLGLMGELKGLTDGIVEETLPDSLLDNKAQSGSRKLNEVSFTKLSQQQVDEFGSRVQKFLDEGRAEIERMKVEHSNKMRRWQKTHKLTQAERQLRTAEWKGHDTSVFPVVADTSDGHTDGLQNTKVEDILDNVQDLVRLKLKPHRDTSLVEKGGLEETQPSIQDPSSLIGGQRASKAPSAAPSEAMSFLQDSTGINNGSYTHDRADAHSSNSAVDLSQPFSTTQGPSGATNTNIAAAGGDDEMDDVDMGLLHDEGIDMDASDLNFELDDLATRDEGNVESHGNTSHHTSLAPMANSTAGPGMGGSTGNGKVAERPLQGSDQNKNAATPAGDGGEGSMFDETGFDFDDGAADGLIDFESGVDMGIDDSAFGDALHGMDKTTDENGLGDQA